MPPDPAKPAATPLRRDVDRDVVQGWLDALSTGACDEQEFLRGIEKLTRRSIEAGWASLALLDQYYRLGKIPADVFNNVKSRLGSQLVGASTEREHSVPLPESDDERTPAAASPKVTRAASRAISTKVPPAKPASPAPAPRAALASASSAATPLAAAPAPPPPAAKQVAHHPVSELAAVTSSADPVVALESSRAPPATQAPVPIATASAAPPAPAPRTVEPLRRTRREVAAGDVLRGRYVIKSVVGRGGTGTVFEAADLYRVDMPDAGQRVALKVLHGQISGSPELLTELQREFQLLQSLSHPNIVRAHDFDRDGDLAFFTMEHLRGLSLTGVLAARNHAVMERPLALAIVRDVGAAVAHAHSRAVVHGDLNPGNIFITNEGGVRVLDFGAAHAPSAGPTLSGSHSDPAPVASPRYASVQLLEGKRPDARDDLYSLACITYLLLTGKHPFGEKTALEAQEQRLKPSRPAELNGKEWRALRVGLAFDRERRPSDVAAWLEAFDWSEAAPHLPLLLSLVRVAQRKRTHLAGAVVATIVIAAALAAAWWASSNFNFSDLHLSNFNLSDLNFGKTQQIGEPNGPSPAGVASSSQPKESSPAAPAKPEAPSAAPPSAAAQPAARGAEPHAQTAPPPSPPPAALPAGEAENTSPSPTRRRAPATPLATESPSSSAAAASQAGMQTHSRIELAADTIEVPITDPAARVVVRRRGSTHGDATFTWWTESGTAKPGQDFMAVAPHQEVIEDGKSAVSLFIPVVSDATRQQPKSFYVVINDPGPGVSLGARTLTMVTIPPSQ